MKFKDVARKLRSLYYNEPFQTFDVLAEDGRSVYVSRRNRLVISPTDRFAFVIGSDDSITQINLKKVAELRIRASQSSRRRKAG